MLSEGGVLFFIKGLINPRRIEEEKWNDGKCTICGKPWILFDKDSQGGRMYKCENDHRCTITYKVDK